MPKVSLAMEPIKKKGQEKEGNKWNNNKIKARSDDLMSKISEPWLIWIRNKENKYMTH